jgi:hypothetical protein
MRMYTMLTVLVLVLLGAVISCAWGEKNGHGKWALHYAGPHDSKAHTCAFSMDNCILDIEVNAPAGPGEFDVYVIAVDVDGIAVTTFGIYGEGRFYFSEWTSCADLEIPTQYWPGCGQGNAVSWFEEQPGPYVNIGILHIYAYGGGLIWTGVDPRAGHADFCDASRPNPLCVRFYDDPAYCILGFGEFGCHPCAMDAQGCLAPGFDLEQYGTCGAVPTNASTWGALKALYR